MKKSIREIAAEIVDAPTRYEIAETSVRWHGASCSAYYADGQAYVWDSVAKHYTTCHSLTERQIARVRRLANRD